jgi:hypothetical protein
VEVKSQHQSQRHHSETFQNPDSNSCYILNGFHHGRSPSWTFNKPFTNPIHNSTTNNNQLARPSKLDLETGCTRIEKIKEEMEGSKSIRLAVILESY